MADRLNKYKSPGAKRLMLEARELRDSTEEYSAQPIDDNLFEWHFTFRGPPGTAFDGGFYHGRLSFPTDYPMKPPSIILLTPNGRFKTNTKICLSISGYHPESWQPSWSVRTALLALVAFMPTKANGAIGSVDYPDEDRRKLAIKSRNWTCNTCGSIKDLLVHPTKAQSRSSDGANSPGQLKASCSTISSDTTIDVENKNRNTNESRAIVQSNEKKEENEIEEQSHCNIMKTNNDSIETNKRTISHSNEIECETRVNSNHSREDGTLEGTSPRQIDQSMQQIENFEERRSVYPQMILKSIFVILSLLILRRIVMVLQA